MKNFILLAAVLACTFISCGEEDPDISGFYTLVSLKKDCDDPEQNISVVAGDNEVLGTTLNFSGTMLFTVGGAFEMDYTLEADFSKEDVFIEGSYALTNKRSPEGSGLTINQSHKREYNKKTKSVIKSNLHCHVEKSFLIR